MHQVNQTISKPGFRNLDSYLITANTKFIHNCLFLIMTLMVTPFLSSVLLLLQPSFSKNRCTRKRGLIEKKKENMDCEIKGWFALYVFCKSHQICSTALVGAVLNYQGMSLPVCLSDTQRDRWILS